MEANAIVLDAPRQLGLRQLALDAPGRADLVVDIRHSGISTGTERLLWTGEMPPFPGLGYPLVPGYESVGLVTQAGPDSGFSAGDTVFVPGASCYGEVRGLFGGSASRVVVPGARVVAVSPALGSDACLLALAATARHALAGKVENPDLIVGHGVLGRLLARMSVAMGRPATVWEIDADRAAGADGYQVVHPDDDPRRDYRAIYDVSGDASLIDDLIARLAPGGELVLAGFYKDRIGFAFPSAFMKEARLRIAAEWKPDDLTAVLTMIDEGLLSLGGLITHRAPAIDAPDAYHTAFGDPGCLKMILDWKGIQ
ncbi:MAG: chlorophyll synthesis pathway protein BchC [Pseudomonadota bacterium]